ncbi:MAG: lysophospholipid acyltransferase family protein [Candidatus Paceibacterota bacterium]|jgi:1-acyl-sn-glycerol-3-phosphate acyltransferase
MNKFGSLLCTIFLKPLIEAFLVKKIEGLENLPKGNFILAVNHQSNLDHVAAGYVCLPRSFRFIGQYDGHSGWKQWLVKAVYAFTGVIPLDRTNSESKKDVLEKAVGYAKKGDIIILYPEGTRTRTGQIGEPKPGVAKIFLGSGVPIVPIAVKGTFELFPPHGKLKIKRIIEIKVGKPIYFEKEFQSAKNLSYKSEEYKDLCQKISEKAMDEIIGLAGQKK